MRAHGRGEDGLRDARVVEAVLGGAQCGKELLGREAPIRCRSALGVLLSRVSRFTVKKAVEAFHSTSLTLEAAWSSYP